MTDIELAEDPYLFSAKKYFDGEFYITHLGQAGIKRVLQRLIAGAQNQGDAMMTARAFEQACGMEGYHGKEAVKDALSDLGWANHPPEFNQKLYWAIKDTVEKTLNVRISPLNIENLLPLSEANTLNISSVDEWLEPTKDSNESKLSPFQVFAKDLPYGTPLQDKVPRNQEKEEVGWIRRQLTVSKKRLDKAEDKGLGL